jgi:hypothetical protein
LPNDDPQPRLWIIILIVVCMSILPGGREPSRPHSIAFKEATGVFLLSRLIILLVSYIGVVMFPPSGQSTASNCVASIRPCVLTWYHWDAVAYVRIAGQGSSSTPDTAFFPFWPLLEHIGGFLLGSSFPDAYYFAGLLLANLCFYFVLVLFYHLLSEEFEPALAKRALYYLAFYPYAMFFFAGYTESLFLLLCLAVFLLLRRGKAFDWWLAGLLGFCAALTRSAGVILAVPFFVVYLQRFWTPGERARYSWIQRLTALAPILLIPAAVLVYMLYLGHTKGDPLVFISQEATYKWHRHLSVPGIAFFPAIGSLFTQPFFTGAVMQNLLDIVFTLFPLMALALNWRRLPLHYLLFAVALALFSLSFPQTEAETLASQPRYMMSIFPIMIIFAFWGKRPTFDRWFLGFSLPLLALNTLLFISHYWVA